MTRIKFSGFQDGSTVAMSVAMGAPTARPLTISAWRAASSTNAGTFDVQVSVDGENFAPITDGATFETVTPGRVRVLVNNFAGWAENDPRKIYVETDMGERYDLQYLDHPDLPPEGELRRLGGTTAGRYPGLLCGHAFRGTDMAGNQVLNATHDQGNGAPLGTLDKTVTVYVSDGMASDSLTFTVRLIDPAVYYADRLKTLAPASFETDRRGEIYISRDGDFTGAPPARAETPTRGGIYHVTLSDGLFSHNTFRQGPAYPWGAFPESIRILFKAGERYFTFEAFDAPQIGHNSSFTTWFHNGPGGGTRAVLDASELAGFSPNPTLNTASLMRSNASGYTGIRLYDIDLHVSDYDVSDITWREWWNILRYTGKSGTLVENTSGSAQNGFNGEILSNGAGVYTQVISDDGAGTLLCRQVVNSSDVDNGVQAFFADGQTLTGLTSGASLTFVAAGSRQDRTRKTPGPAINYGGVRGMLCDRVVITGASDGISGLGPGAVLSDMVIKNYWNYGAQVTGGGALACSWSEIGVVTVQPRGYAGTPRDFGGATVSGNRNLFNAMVDETRLATNDISHTARRFHHIDYYSAHYCALSIYGGHGGLHQPAHRMFTDGAEFDGQGVVQFFGCAYHGSANQIQFNTLGRGAPPMTPYAIRIENCHLRSSFAQGDALLRSAYTNFILRNCLLEFSPDALQISQNSLRFISDSGAASYNTDPDGNAVPPIVDFNTFVSRHLSGSIPLLADATLIRSTPVTYADNAYAIETLGFTSVPADILAQNDELGVDFDIALRPLPGGSAYQQAQTSPPKIDAFGQERPKTMSSRGAFEP